MAETNKSAVPVSEKEVELLRGAFKGNEYLLKIVRSLFYGAKIDKKDKDLIKSTFSNADLREALRKKTYPKPLSPSADTPIGQVADFWSGTDQNFIGAPKEKIYQIVASKQQVLEMLNRAFELLTNPDGEKVNVEYNPRLILKDEFQVGLIARNLYIRTIEQGLLFAKMAADQEIITPEELKKKAKVNSNQ